MRYTCCCCCCCWLWWWFCCCFFYPRNLLLKFGQNQVSNIWNVAFVVVVVIVVHVVVIVVVFVLVDPTHLPLKFGLNQVRNSWDINDIEFVVGGGGGVGWWTKVIFVSHKLLRWVVVELGLWQYSSEAVLYLKWVWEFLLFYS